MRTALAIGTLLSVLLGSAAEAVTWTFVSPYPDDDFRTENARLFAEKVQSASNGEFRIIVNANSGGGDPLVIRSTVESGQAPIGMFDLSALGAEKAVFEVGMVPFLAGDYDGAFRLWQAAVPVLRPVLADQGLMLLYGAAGSAGSLFTIKAIDKPEDLNGIRLRANDPLTQQLATALGAQPVSIDPAKLAQAFRNGTVAAMFASPETAVATAAWGYVTDAYFAGVSFPMIAVVVNPMAYAKLDAETQRMLLSAAIQAQNPAWTASVNATNAQMRQLQDRDLVVTEPSPQLHAAFRAAGAEVTSQWLRRAGADGRAILDAYGWPR